MTLYLHRGIIGGLNMPESLITEQSVKVLENQGLTQILKDMVEKLKEEYPESVFISDGTYTQSEWNATMDKLTELNENRKKSGLETLFTGGIDKDRSKWQTSFIIKPEQEITFTKEELKELFAAMGVSISNTPIDTADENASIILKSDSTLVTIPPVRESKTNETGSKTENFLRSLFCDENGFNLGRTLGTTVGVVSLILMGKISANLFRGGLLAKLSSKNGARTKKSITSLPQKSRNATPQNTEVKNVQVSKPQSPSVAITKDAEKVKSDAAIAKNTLQTVENEIVKAKASMEKIKNAVNKAQEEAERTNVLIIKARLAMEKAESKADDAYEIWQKSGGAKNEKLSAYNYARTEKDRAFDTLNKAIAESQKSKAQYNKLMEELKHAEDVYKELCQKRDAADIAYKDLMKLIV